MLDIELSRDLGKLERFFEIICRIASESPDVYESADLQVAEYVLNQVRLIRSMLPECDIPDDVDFCEIQGIAWSLWASVNCIWAVTDDRTIGTVDGAMYSIARAIDEILSRETLDAILNSGESIDDKPILARLVSYLESKETVS